MTATIEAGRGSTRSNGIDWTVRSSWAMSSARKTPAASPRSAPSAPIATAWARTNATSWRRIAPAARSKPSSRMRSVTVIERVLKIRKAPTNRATAAINAVVERKSAVDELSEAATSAGDDRTYG